MFIFQIFILDVYLFISSVFLFNLHSYFQMTEQNQLDNSNTTFTDVNNYYNTFHFHIKSTCNHCCGKYILFLKRDPKGFGLICPKCKHYVNLFILLGSYIQDKRYALEVITLYIYKLISYNDDPKLSFYKYVDRIKDIVNNYYYEDSILYDIINADNTTTLQATLELYILEREEPENYNNNELTWQVYKGQSPGHIIEFLIDTLYEDYCDFYGYGDNEFDDECILADTEPWEWGNEEEQDEFFMDDESDSVDAGDTFTASSGDF